MINANQSMSMQVNSKFKPLTITDEPSRKVLWLWWTKRLPDEGGGDDDEGVCDDHGGGKGDGDECII